MSTLDNYLSQMDQKLFEGDSSDLDFDINPEDDPTVSKYLKGLQYPDIISQENIPNSLARSLLSPDDYNPDCKYQLITMRDATLVVKIDPTKKDTDSDRLTEYPLKSIEDVQSYGDLQIELHNEPTFITHGKERPDTTDYNLYRNTKSYAGLYMLCILGILFAIGIALIMYVTTM